MLVIDSKRVFVAGCGLMRPCGIMGVAVFLALVGLRRSLPPPQLQLQEKHHQQKVAA